MATALDKMMGKWKVDKSKTTNLDNWAAAMNVAPEVQERLKSDTVNMSFEISRDGDVFTLTTWHGDKKETYTFKLGEKFHTNTMGTDMKNVLKMEGDSMVGEHDAFGNISTTRRSLNKAGKMVVDTTVNGVTMTKVYDRV